MKKFLKIGIIPFLLFLGSCQAPPPKQTPPHMVTVTKPVQSTLPLYLDYTGHVTPYVSVDVMAQVSGILTKQFFVQGQDVKEGDLLLLIDPRPYEAALFKAKAELEQTEANLAFAKEKAQRYTPLVKEEYVSQLDYDEYVTNVLSNEALREQNLADIATAKINLGYCYIRAPMSCTTGQLQVKPGNYVDANSNTNLVTLNQIQPIYVDFYVPETDLTQIQIKQNAKKLKLQVFTDTAHSRTFEGELTLIDNQVNENTGSILMEGTFANEEKLLWPGHFVDVRLILEEIQALVVPTQAVLVGQTGHYVYVVSPDGTAQRKSVEIGQRHGEKTVIYSGLTTDDVVVVEGQLNIYSGMKVSTETKGQQ